MVKRFHGYGLCYCLNPENEFELAWIWNVTTQTHFSFISGLATEFLPQYLISIPACVFEPI